MSTPKVFANTSNERVFALATERKVGATVVFLERLEARRRTEWCWVDLDPTFPHRLIYDTWVSEGSNGATATTEMPELELMDTPWTPLSSPPPAMEAEKPASELDIMWQRCRIRNMDIEQAPAPEDLDFGEPE